MPPHRPNIGFIPTPPAAIDAILELANVTEADVIYDLGSGDGQILITAAQRYGSRGVGIDIDPKRIEEATEKARQAGVSVVSGTAQAGCVQFLQQDLFESNFQDATVVILYLLPHLNLRLRPALFQQLKPGSRIISVDFDMGDWTPEQIIKLEIEEESTLYYWTIPETIMID